MKSVRIQSFSGPHFPAFGLNMEIYVVNLLIQFECGKIRTRKTRNTESFYAVLVCYNFDVWSQEGLISRILITLRTGLLTFNIKLITRLKNEICRRDQCFGSETKWVFQTKLFINTGVALISLSNAVQRQMFFEIYKMFCWD